MKSLIYFLATSFYYIFGNVKHLVHTHNERELTGTGCGIKEQKVNQGEVRKKRMVKRNHKHIQSFAFS